MSDDRIIHDPSIVLGTDGSPKNGDPLFSKQGNLYYPKSNFSLDKDEILPPPSLNLELLIEFRRGEEVLGGLNCDDVMVTEDIQKDYSFKDVQGFMIEDAMRIYNTAVELKVGDTMYVNGELYKTVTLEDLNALSY